MGGEDWSAAIGSSLWRAAESPGVGGKRASRNAGWRSVSNLRALSGPMSGESLVEEAFKPPGRGICFDLLIPLIPVSLEQPISELRELGPRELLDLHFDCLDSCHFVRLPSESTMIHAADGDRVGSAALAAASSTTQWITRGSPCTFRPETRPPALVLRRTG